VIKHNAKAAYTARPCKDKIIYEHTRRYAVITFRQAHPSPSLSCRASPPHG